MNLKKSRLRLGLKYICATSLGNGFHYFFLLKDYYNENEDKMKIINHEEQIGVVNVG